MTQEGVQDETNINPVETHENAGKIMACFYSKKEDPYQFDRLLASVDESDLVNVIWGPTESTLDRMGLKHGEVQTHVMSQVDEKFKYSEDYAPCTGMVAVGMDKGSGKNISFMTHEFPLRDFTRMGPFLKDLESSLREIASKCDPETIDIVFFSGLVAGMTPYFKTITQGGYDREIENISRVCKEVTGTDLRVIVDPKDHHAQVDRAFFDTPNRRLFVERSFEPLP